MGDTRIGKAVLEITIDDKQYKVGLDGVEKEAKKTAKSMEGINRAVNFAVFKELASIGVGALKAVGSAIGDLIERGSNFQALDSAFGSLATSIGETKEAMLATTREATKGLISDMDIMAASNKAMLLGLPVTSESMGTMAKAAMVLGRAMGQSATKSLDDLTTALGRSSPLILDNLGLTVKVSEANEKYAAKLGKSAKSLTDNEKKMAFYEAAMDAALKKVDEMGDVHLTLKEQVTAAKNSWTNFTDRLGAAINTSPQLAAGFEAIRNALEGAFGSNQQDMIATIVKLVANVAIAATTVAQAGVEAARVLYNGFQGVKIIMNAILAGIFSTIRDAAQFIKNLADEASRLPLIGDKFKEMSGGMQEVVDIADSMATNFAALGNEQIDAAAKVNAGFDSVSQGIYGVHEAMVNAKGAVIDLGSAGGQAVKKLGDDVGEAASRTAEEAKKIADVQRDLQNKLSLQNKEGLDRRLEELRIAHEKEVESIRSLKGIKSEELEQMLADSQMGYEREIEMARAAGDTIKQGTLQLHNELAMMRMTGQQRELALLEQKKQAEIDSIAHLRENYTADYEQRLKDIEEKYGLMTERITGHYSDVKDAAAAAGIKTRAELEQNYQTALRTYQQMLQSGLFTEAQLLEAKKKADEAKEESTGKRVEYELTASQAIVAGAQGALDMLGQKYKVAAIAGALISTYQAVAKAYASAPPPFSFALAAAALAAGMANVNRIRSAQPGFREGTPDLDFASFGRESWHPLHGDEAVIPRGGGHALAGEIARALPDGEDGLGAKLDTLIDLLESQPQTIQRAFAQALRSSA